MEKGTTESSSPIYSSRIKPIPDRLLPSRACFRLV
jgi:hypothetical protein